MMMLKNPFGNYTEVFQRISGFGVFQIPLGFYTHD